MIYINLGKNNAVFKCNKKVRSQIKEHKCAGIVIALVVTNN